MKTAVLVTNYDSTSDIERIKKHALAHGVEVVDVVDFKRGQTMTLDRFEIVLFTGAGTYQRETVKRKHSCCVDISHRPGHAGWLRLRQIVGFWVGEPVEVLPTPPDVVTRASFEKTVGELTAIAESYAADVTRLTAELDQASRRGGLEAEDRVTKLRDLLDITQGQAADTKRELHNAKARVGNLEILLKQSDARLDERNRAHLAAEEGLRELREKLAAAEARLAKATAGTDEKILIAARNGLAAANVRIVDLEKQVSDKERALDQLTARAKLPPLQDATPTLPQPFRVLPGNVDLRRGPGRPRKHPLPPAVVLPSHPHPPIVPPAPTSDLTAKEALKALVTMGLMGEDEARAMLWESG